MQRALGSISYPSILFILFILSSLPALLFVSVSSRVPVDRYHMRESWY
jgi:hypothetical protein